MAKVENQCKDIFKQCSQVLATVDKVEANINSSKKLNKKLSFMNDHQKCTVLTYKERYEKTKQELISVQAGVVSSLAKEEEGYNIKETTVHLEDELRMVAVIFICLVAEEFSFKRQILGIGKIFHFISFHFIPFHSIPFHFISFHFISISFPFPFHFHFIYM